MEQINHLSTHLHDEAAVVFWAQIGDPDPYMQGVQADCTEWRGRLDGAGRPVHLVAGEHVYANLYALLVSGHEWPSPRFEIVHACGNDRCVNDKHLSWRMIDGETT